MTEPKTPEISGSNTALVALVAFVAGIAIMYGIGLYFANREVSANAGNHDAS